MPTINRQLIGVDNDDEHYKALAKDKQKMIIILILPEIMPLFE